MVNRIRELPQNSKIVATNTESPDEQPNHHAVLGAADSRPDLILTGHQENAEFTLSMCHPSDPFVLSGGKDKLVVLWSIQDHISTLAESSAAKSPATPASSSGKRPAKAGNEKSSDSPTVGPQGVYQGHEDTVEDVQFCPSSALEFCSVGDDTCLILWDARVGTGPSIKVEKAHNAVLHCVDWNPPDENLILTGSVDNSVRMFDRRNLTSGGVLEHQYINLKWSSDEASVFGSAAEDGLLSIGDHEKVLAALMTISMFGMLRNMIKKDHFDNAGVSLPTLSSELEKYNVVKVDDPKECRSSRAKEKGLGVRMVKS